MNILSHPDPEGYGPMGTPNRGREERIARSDREAARRYRQAAQRLERDSDPIGSVELASLRQERRGLTDLLYEMRREVAQLRAELKERISQQLADELPSALDYSLAIREGSRNGTQARRR